MKILKYIILFLIVLNIPEVVVRNFGSSLGTISSYSVFLFLILYYLFTKDRGSLNMPLILIGISYYLISSFQSHWPFKEFAFISIKFFVVIICGNELSKRITALEMSLFFVLGALTIILHPILFANTYGRYSGFYFNPNSAGYIAITSFALTFVRRKGLIKTGKTLISSLGGLMTFSRTFVALWALLNLLSIKIDIKNLKIIFFGIGVVVIIFSVKDILKLNTKRFNEFEALINNDKSGAEGLTEDSRTATWSNYYEAIYDKPIYGNGFHYFQGGHLATVGVGVHNSFLLIIGEAGILPFMLFVLYFIYLLFYTYRYFKQVPYLFMMTIGLVATLLADHGFFTFYTFPLITMWIHNQIIIEKNKKIEGDYLSTNLI